MAIKATTAFAEAKTRGVKLLIYSRSGMGKTLLAVTVPQPKKWVILAIEPGLLCHAAANQKRVYGPEWVPVDIDVWVIETLEDLIDAHNFLQEADSPYIGVYLDSITEIGEKVLANALAQVKDPRQAYGELQEKMTDCLKKFRDLDGMHVVFCAKEMTNKDNCTPLQIPAMPGSKLGLALPYLMDAVLHLDVVKHPDGTSERFLQTQPSAEFDAKDRSGALDPIEEPNLSKLISKIVK